MTSPTIHRHAPPTGMIRRAPLPRRGGSDGGDSSNTSEENANDVSHDEIDPDNRLQPRSGSGPGETPDRTSETAGVYFRDLPGHEQSNGKVVTIGKVE